MNSFFTVLGSFFSGDTAISQLCETFKHFDLNTHDKGYLPKDLPSLEQFSLSYEGHYRTRSVELLRGKLLTKYKGSIDWYLSQVAKTNAAILEKGLDEVSCKQLSIIKHGFEAQHVNGKNYVSLIERVTNPYNITSIEQFKEYLLRLIEVNPTIKNFLENRSGEMPQIIEVRNHQDDYKGSMIANDLPTQINNFVGRKDVFSEIDKILESNQIVAINAFAGTGKSSTALEYGYKAEDEGKTVRWFASDTSGKIEANYRQLAMELGIKLEEINSDHEQGRKNLINGVNRAIVKLGKPILLILDNLEHYKDAEEYLKNLPKKLVKVIITTRDNNLLNNPKQHIILGSFNTEEATTYINANLSGRVNSKTSEDLIKLLGNKEGEVLPYTLLEAVSYLKQNPLCSVQKYIEIVKNSDEHVKNSLLVDSLKDSPLELQILQYAAFLDPDSMSIEIFKELLQIDEEQLQSPIAKLEKLSLVSLNHNEDNAYLKMHRLAQDEIKRYIKNQKQQQLLKPEEIQQNLIVSLNNLMPKVTYSNEQSYGKIAKLYYPHIQKILGISTEVVSTTAKTAKGKLYEKLGNYNQYITLDYQQSLNHHLSALKIYQEIYHEGNHPDIARSLNNVGIAYEKLGDKIKALELYKQCYFMRCKLLGQDHHDTQAAKNIIISLDAKFSDNGEERISILDRGIVDKNVIEVRQKIQKKVLNKIYELASKGDWGSAHLTVSN